MSASRVLSRHASLTHLSSDSPTPQTQQEQQELQQEQQQQQVVSSSLEINSQQLLQQQQQQQQQQADRRLGVLTSAPNRTNRSTNMISSSSSAIGGRGNFIYGNSNIGNPFGGSSSSSSSPLQRNRGGTPYIENMNSTSTTENRTSIVVDDNSNPFLTREYDDSSSLQTNRSKLHRTGTNDSQQKSLERLFVQLKVDTERKQNESIFSPDSPYSANSRTSGVSSTRRKRMSVDTRLALQSPHKQDRFVAGEDPHMTSTYTIQTVSRGGAMAMRLAAEEDKNYHPGRTPDDTRRKLFSQTISHAEMYRNVVQMEMLGSENYNEDRIVRIASPTKPSPRAIRFKNPPLTTTSGSISSTVSSPVSANDYNLRQSPYSKTGSLLGATGTLRSPISQKYSSSPLSLTAQSVLKWSNMRSGIWEVPRAPFRVLDAPSLQDDFYLNLLDWSARNIVAVGLMATVYLYDSVSASVSRLCDLGANSLVTSVAFLGDGSHIAVGNNSGTVQVWDVDKGMLVREYSGHSARVGVLAKCCADTGFVSGSRDKSIILRDTRVSHSSVRVLEGHTQEVCGLRWNMDGGLLASGGNDNKLLVWDSRSTTPVFVPEAPHVAAIKGLAWSPHIRHRLASGGGTRDQFIKVWNTQEGALVKAVDSGSQVCNLAWTRDNRLVSSHGYSRNQVLLWDAARDALAAGPALIGHTSRVLYMAVAPDEHAVVTGAGDDTLRFWKIADRAARRPIAVDPQALRCIM